MTPWADASTVKLTGIQTEAAQRAVESATVVLYELSGRRFGLVEDKVRPYGSGALPDLWGPWGATVGWGLGSPAFPYEGAGPYGGFTQWMGWDPVNRNPLRECPLPGRVEMVKQVLIDGTVFTAWTVTDHKYLIRTDGADWPTQQNLDLDSSQPNTWEVTYVRGRKPPDGAVNACTTLAVELAKYDDPALAAANGGVSRLPSNTTSVTQQGVTLSFLTVADMIKLQITGISSVDAWLNALNPDKRRGRSTVRSPDITRNVRRY